MNTLHDIYGAGAAEQVERYRQAAATFTALYGPGDVAAFRAPGRVNLIGEHTDYNQGYVLPVALDRDMVIFVRPRQDEQVHLRNVEPGFEPVAFAAGPDISPEPPGHWGNYARASAQALARHLQRPVRGLDGLVVGAPPDGVPRGAGLSSSSALTVAMAVALAHYNGWRPEGVEMARFCSEAEWYVGTRGGIMDHFIALLGRRDQALFLDCRPDQQGAYVTDYVPLPQDHRLLVVDSGVHHENARGQYNARVAACRAGVGLLKARHPGITHLRDVEDVPWQELASQLPLEISVRALLDRKIDLGDLPGLSPETVLHVYARCRHVWGENRRVVDAVAALRAGDVATLGALLDQAHKSARDDYEISCPELESLVRAARARCRA